MKELLEISMDDWIISLCFVQQVLLHSDMTFDLYTDCLTLMVPATVLKQLCLCEGKKYIFRDKRL